MQREIKFRAYNMDNNKMYHFGLFDLDEYYLIQEGLIIEAMPIMQFTGLQDKNGKEIYEGDIVQTPFGHSSVEFSHGVFGLNHDFLNPEKKTMLGSWGQEHNLRTLDDGYYKEIVVVGNIYETNLIA
jgi:uncharacterized phage protein (TIGR01671 family)